MVVLRLDTQYTPQPHLAGRAICYTNQNALCEGGGGTFKALKTFNVRTFPNQKKTTKKNHLKNREAKLHIHPLRQINMFNRESAFSHRIVSKPHVELKVSCDEEEETAGMLFDL